MRVICIDNSRFHSDIPATLLKEGDIYTAHEAGSECACPSLGYALDEVPINPNTGKAIFFFKWRFVPLDGPCEKEILEERVEQACAEVTALYEAIPQPEIATA